MTLVELLMAVGIGSLILAAIAFVSFYSSRSFVAIGNYVDLETESRDTLDRMLKEIRQARSFTTNYIYKTNELALIGADGVTLKYAWSPSTRQLTRERPIGSTPEVLLPDCDTLFFTMCMRVPIRNSTNEFYPATNIAGSYDVSLCKMIDLKWKCSRTILGKKVNSESVQTAQIVLRNKQ